ncbi:penicillin-binding protein 2 [Lachnospiraceae bacterium]|nr:penicillin-binding protein 2 [Lachnospiraceae bacterium]
MFGEIRDKLIGFITSRLFILGVVLIALFSVLVYRLFNLQIIKGESYQDNFTLRIEREKTIKSTRGTIYDRNGNILASDKLAYSVTIEDNYDSDGTRNMKLNNTINRLIGIVEKNGDTLNNDFNIVVDQNGHFAFTLEGKQQLRFLADIYGRTSIENLKNKERNATADDVIAYLCGPKVYGIGTYTEKTDGSYDFKPEEGYTNEELLKVVTVRYNLGLNSYQKYIATTVATNVNEKTVAEVLENQDSLQGVNIAEDTVRTYIDDPSFSHILGYTGKISNEELAEYNGAEKKGDSTDATDYELNDMVGKSGIEQVMETKLQGRKGKQTIFVDNLGRVTETGEKTDPVAGSNLYLTIDSDLQKAIYQILEQKIAGIVLSKLTDRKEADLSGQSSSSDIRISIDEVYFALFDNNYIDMSHLASPNAGNYEKQVYSVFSAQKQQALSDIKEELLNGTTAYNDSEQEMQAYEAYTVTMLQSSAVNIFDVSAIDAENEIYLKWKEGTCSLKEYLAEAVAKDWIDTTKIKTKEQYLDSDEIYKALVDYICDELVDDQTFAKEIYRYMIRKNEISGYQICHLPYEQGKLADNTGALADLDAGTVSAYSFMASRIRSLEITPADLALDPCSGSCVVTNVKTGEVLAVVSYPSYNNSRLANSVDSAYFASLQKNKALPLYNYATQQKTAPGSTFKPLSSTAALEEGAVTAGETIDCEGEYEKISPPPHCWVYPRSTHGPLNIVGAIQNSCNFFFYEVGYRLSLVNGKYDSDTGLKKLAEYVNLYGLSEKSGIEITESEPQVSTFDAVRSAIGQGKNAYTTVGLARYVTTVANEGTCYNLSLLDKLTDSNGNVLTDYTPSVRNEVNVASSTWNLIHEGMREAVAHYDAFEDFPITAAGKTGTAQQTTSRPNHALFIGFAPYNEPEIAITTRIAYGYTSSNAAEVSREVMKYYFKLEDKDNIITGAAVLPDSAAIGD